MTSSHSIGISLQSTVCSLQRKNEHGGSFKVQNPQLMEVRFGELWTACFAAAGQKSLAKADEQWNVKTKLIENYESSIEKKGRPLLPEYSIFNSQFSIFHFLQTSNSKHQTLFILTILALIPAQSANSARAGRARYAYVIDFIDKCLKSLWHGACCCNLLRRCNSRK